MRVSGLGLRVWGLEFRVQSASFRIKVQGFRLRVCIPHREPYTCFESGNPKATRESTLVQCRTWGVGCRV